MKNIKDVIIGVFAVIGFAAIVTGFTNEKQEIHTSPESHVWEAALAAGEGTTAGRLYIYNKVTGEVRKYNRNFPGYKMENWRDRGKEYLIMQDVISIPLKEK